METEKIFTVPIYDCVLRVIVAKDLPGARKKYDHLFGEFADENYEGLCCWTGHGHFALFFSPASARKPDVVAHEVFHLTHRIMEWAGVEHDADHHEAGALLCGYLFKLVQDALRGKPKVRVKRV